MSNLVLSDVVRVEKEVVVTTSDVVAKTFKKQHKHVLRDIEALIEGSDGIDLGFEECTYLDGKGRSQKQYTINRDGFMLLVFGFTGEKAKEVKLAFIDAFNKMEEHIRKPAQLNLSRLEMAQLLLESEQERAQLEEHNAVLEHTVDHYTPKVAAYEHVIDPKELYRLQQIGKILGVKVNKFLERLREQRYLGESRTSLGKGPFYNRPSVAMVNGGEEKIKMDVHHRYLVVT